VSAATTLHADADSREQGRRRLLSVKGHIEGLIRMLEDPRVYCVDILQQLKAIRGAIDRTSEVILKRHLKGHVVTAHERGDADKIVAELMDVLKYR
jgi:DNA-binding FrmR family transcriptional regulator